MGSDDENSLYVDIPLKRRVKNAVTILAAFGILLVALLINHYQRGDLEETWRSVVAIYFVLGIGGALLALANKRKPKNPSKISLSDASGQAAELRPLNDSIKEGWSFVAKTIAGLVVLIAICVVLYLGFIGIATLPISVAIIIGAIIIALALIFK